MMMLGMAVLSSMVVLMIAFGGFRLICHRGKYSELPVTGKI